MHSVARPSFSHNKRCSSSAVPPPNPRAPAHMKVFLLALASCVAAVASQVSARKPRGGGELPARPSCPHVRASARCGVPGAAPGAPASRLQGRVRRALPGWSGWRRGHGDGAGLPCVRAFSTAITELSLGACETDHPPHPQPLFANKTQTLKRAAVGAGDNLLQYVPPLKAGLVASEAAAVQQLADAPFDPATADWAKIYTGYPQPVTDGTILCLSDFAVCAFANCTVSFQSDPPVAECGCLPIRAGVPGPSKPNGLPVPSPYNQMTIGKILDAKLRAATVKLCGNGTGCPPGAAPFCAEVLPSAATGRPTMYGGRFDLISTYSPTAWTTADTAPGSGQGFPGGAITCNQGGALAECNGGGVPEPARLQWSARDLLLPGVHAVAGDAVLRGGAGGDVLGVAARAERGAGHPVAAGHARTRPRPRAAALPLSPARARGSPYPSLEAGGGGGAAGRGRERPDGARFFFFPLAKNDALVVPTQEKTTFTPAKKDALHSAPDVAGRERDNMQVTMIRAHLRPTTIHTPRRTAPTPTRRPPFAPRPRPTPRPPPAPPAALPSTLSSTLATVAADPTTGGWAVWGGLLAAAAAGVASERTRMGREPSG